MGLDLDLFEDEVPEDLVCVACHKVLMNPVHAACAHLFCAACLKRRVKTAKLRTCPTCDSRLALNKTEPPSVMLKVKLLSLLIRCSHGCGKVCKLAELPDHVTEECPNAPVTCPNVQQGCKMKVKRAELQEHVEECEHRSVQCEACGQRTVYVDLFTHQSRKRCLENKLRQQLIKAIRVTNTDVRQHRRYLERQHIRLEQQQRQRVLEHFRQTTAASRQQRRGNTALYNSNGGSSDASEYESPRVALGGGESSRHDPTHAHSAEVFMTSSQPLESDGELSLLFNTPSPSRSGVVISTCRNCQKKFRESSNSPTSCRWHPGIIELFTCYTCGRLDYQKGCMMGYHEL